MPSLKWAMYQIQNIVLHHVYLNHILLNVDDKGILISGTIDYLQDSISFEKKVILCTFKKP